MKNIKKLLLIIVTFVLSITTVYATGSANLVFGGNSSVNVDNEFTLTLSISNINTNTGVVSVGGTIKFDPEYLQYIDSTGATTPYQIQKQTASAASGSVKIAGIDNTMEAGIKTTTQIFSIKFKALKEGTTTVSFENGELADVDEILNATFGNKLITINVGSSTPDTPPTPTKSSIKTLSKLRVSGFDLTPAFDKDVTSYKLTVPYETESLNLDAVPTDSKASVEITGSNPLKVGANNVLLTVTAEDNTKKVYSINVTRQDKENEEQPVKSSDTTLKSLEIKGFDLTPAFDKDTTTYTLSVPNTTKSLNIKGIANDSKSTVKVTGGANLAEGMNTVKIVVTAENGSTKVYTVNVNREASAGSTPTNAPVKSSNNYLSNMYILDGELSPSFKSTVSNYWVTVPYDCEKLNLSTFVSDGRSKVNVTGNENFKVNQVNVVEIDVTAEDGSTRVYTINVTRSSKNSATKLKDITITGVTSSNGNPSSSENKINLTPNFDSDTYEYKMEIDGNIDSLNISAFPNDSESTVEITGNKELKEGNNTILIKVTDKNGFVQYYKIDVYKKSSSIGAAVKNIFEYPLWVLILLGILILLLFLLIYLIILAKRKRSNSSESNPTTIEFKPEFNFSSKNGTDDDYVEAGGVLNQTTYEKKSEVEGSEPKHIAQPTFGETKTIEIPYDPYDDVVTKDELIDAINEKDVAKLKMLYEQEMLNREKERLKELEKSNKRD